MKIKLIIISLLLSLFFSCSKDLQENDNDDTLDFKEISFNIKIANEDNLSTRSSKTTDFFENNKVLYYQVYSDDFLPISSGEITIERYIENIKIAVPKNSKYIEFYSSKNIWSSDIKSKDNNKVYRKLFPFNHARALLIDKPEYYYYGMINILDKVYNYSLDLNILNSVFKVNLLNTSSKLADFRLSFKVPMAVFYDFDSKSLIDLTKDDVGFDTDLNNPIAEVSKSGSFYTVFHMNEFQVDTLKITFYNSNYDIYYTKDIEAFLILKRGRILTINIDESELLQQAENLDIRGDIIINELNEDELEYNIPVK